MEGDGIMRLQQVRKLCKVQQWSRGDPDDHTDWPGTSSMEASTTQVEELTTEK